MTFFGRHRITCEFVQQRLPPVHEGLSCNESQLVGNSSNMKMCCASNILHPIFVCWANLEVALVWLELQLLSS